MNKDVKTNWHTLRDITAVDSSTIADNDLFLDARPSGTKSIDSEIISTMSIIGFGYNGAVANDTFTVKLWGFRSQETIAEYIASVTVTIGTSALASDPESADTITGYFADTMTITDVWTPAASGGVLISAGGDEGNNRIGRILLDTLGLSYIYAECTANSGTGDLKLIYTYLNG